MPRFDHLDFKSLIAPVARAESAVSRLDERLRTSPYREGWINRIDYQDAAASLWNDGELIQMQDFVLHDHSMDIRTPTFELGRAREILTARRKALIQPPQDLLLRSGVKQLVGSWEVREMEPEQRPVVSSTRKEILDLLAFTSALENDTEIEKLDRPLKRPDQDDPDDAYTEWRAVLREVPALPDVLAVAVLIQRWAQIDPLPRQFWVGRILAGIYLLGRKRTSILLPLHLGKKVFRRQNVGSKIIRIESLLDIVEQIEVCALDGLAVHDRLVMAASGLNRKLAGRRKSSRLGEVVELFLSQPLVSVAMVTKRLKISERGALMLIDELGSATHEMSGRSHYRAWSVAAF